MTRNAPSSSRRSARTAEMVGLLLDALDVLLVSYILASSRDEMNVVEHGKRESASAGVLHRPRICVRVAKNAGRLQTDGR